MSFYQWLKHFRSWLRRFPLPTHDEHSWGGELGERKHTCYFCGAVWIDNEITEQELAEELRIQVDWSTVLDSGTGKNDNRLV